MDTLLIPRIQHLLASENYSNSTQKTYLYWITDFIRYHRNLSPVIMNKSHVKAYFDNLSAHRRISLNTQKTILNALIFLFHRFLQRMDLDLSEYYGAKTSQRLPNVVASHELQALFHQLSGVTRLCALLMYGCGLRITEVTRLRVRDIDLDHRFLFVRPTGSSLSRKLTLPVELVPVLQRRLAAVHAIYNEDKRDHRWRGTELPLGLTEEAATSYEWQFLFPAVRMPVNPDTGTRQRYAVSEQSVQRAVKKAVAAAGIDKSISCNTLRHTFAASMLQRGWSIRALQAQLGHADTRSTAIYLQVFQLDPHLVYSSLSDLIWHSPSIIEFPSTNNEGSDAKGVKMPVACYRISPYIRLAS